MVSMILFFFISFNCFLNFAKKKKKQEKKGKNDQISYHGSPPPIIMEYLMSSKVTHKLYSQSVSSFLQCDPDFVLRVSNYTKFRSHHLAFNQFYLENFQDIDQQSNSFNNSQFVSGTHSFASESKGLKRICWSGFYICFRKSIWVKPLKVVEKVKQNKKWCSHFQN